jgi:hypothetical protein
MHFSKGKEELFLLIEALKINFSLMATINKTSIPNQYTLYLSKDQMPLIINLVKNHIPGICILRCYIN